MGITQCEGARESTRYSDKVGITHWVTLRQVNHLWSTRENTRDWAIRGWVGGGFWEGAESGSTWQMYNDWLVWFGCNLGQSFRMNTWTAEPSFTQIGLYFLFCLRRGSHSVRGLYFFKCWLIDLSDLGVTWVRASGWIPEQLSQVSPKSDHFFSLLDGFVLAVELIVLTLSVDLLTCWIWV